MNKGLNKVMLIGVVDDEPETRHAPGGRPVTSFTLAVTRSWASVEGQSKEETEWFNIVAWGSLAEICDRRLERGSRIYLDGRLQTRRWQDSAGKSYFRTEVVATKILLLDLHTPLADN